MARITSKKYSVNWRDIRVGLGMAIVTPIMVTAITTLESGSFAFDWRKMATAGIGAGLAYLGKKFLDPQQKVEVIKKDKEVNP